jgi:hypothetical protein
MAEEAPNAQVPAQQPAALDDIRPEEVYSRMASYVSETENLISLLRDTLSKAEAQLSEIVAFDSRMTQLGTGMEPIDTASLQTEIDDIRKHIGGLESFRDKVKLDMENVKKISEKIAGIVSRYLNS